MQTKTVFHCSLAGLAAVLLLTPGCDAATRTTTEVIADSEADYQAQMRAAAQAREKNPDWKPACPEIGVIQVGQGKGRGTLKSFCVNVDGNILACCASSTPQATAGGKKDASPATGEIRAYSPEGKLLKSLPVPITPGAISVDKDGSIYVGGGGRVLKMDQEGKVLASADSPVANAKVALSKEMEDMLKESGRNSEAQRASYLRSMEQRRAEITGMAVTKDDVFMACPSPDDFTYRVYRMDHELKNAKLVVEKLRGCCGQMDIQAAEDKLWIPHNARHRVECRDRDGKELSQFGKAGRVKPQEFGGCCEPKNLRFTAAGEILAAESGPPTCIKKFSKEGKFLGVVAVLESDGSCVRVTVDSSADGKRFYLLDTTKDAIRVFGAKG
jgi:hypothetical protein